AERQLRAMADEFPQDSRALRELHALLKEQGREEEALEAIDAAVQRDPADVELLLALASHRLLVHRMEGAEAAYHQVLKLEPANALANVGLAVGYELSNQDAALARLVGEAEQRGASAETLNFIRAFDHRRARRFAEGLAALELVPEELETGRRLHLLGQLHEGLGNYEQAFAAFSRMNEIQRADVSAPEERAAGYRTTVRSHCAMVTPQWVQGWRQNEPTDDRPSPVFLVGFPRSGTTLLDTMLMGHPRIEVLEEEPALRHANEHLPEFVDLPTAKSEQIQAARDAYFQTAQAITPLDPCNLLIDKNPLTMNQLPIALRIFPDARVILALRHPCDVVLSCFVTNFRLNAGMSSFLRLDTAAELYDLSFRYFEQAQHLLEIPQHTVVYEDVVADREGQLRSLIEFLGVEWRDEVLDHESTARSRGRIKTASYAQVGQPIYSRSAGRWENYRQHLEPVLPMLEPWVRKFGYSL
ncbi:MAG TPA: sulfotransferase, partial [Sphingomicrobium sp.]|nr:sulfotransferase [Sphingomicrobium sp.]